LEVSYNYDILNYKKIKWQVVREKIVRSEYFILKEKASLNYTYDEEYVNAPILIIVRNCLRRTDYTKN